MSKTTTIQQEMITALKNKDSKRKEILSVLLSALKLKAKDKKSELTLDEENAIIKKEIKQTKETLDSAPKERTDIIDECNYMLSVLNEFAPEEMTKEQVEQIIKDVLLKLNIESPSLSDKGKIMKELMPQVKGKADGQMVNSLVGEIIK